YPLADDLADTHSVDDTSTLSGSSVSEVGDNSLDNPSDVPESRKRSRRPGRAAAFGLVTSASVLVTYLTVIFSPLVFSFQTWSSVRSPWMIASVVAFLLVFAGLLAFFW